MSRFVEGEDRGQASFLPACLADYIDDDNPARAIDAFVEALDLDSLGFRSLPAATGRPGYHPSMLLRLYIYGYLNRIHSSRRLERECHRNIELMWLTGRLAPDHKTIADFRRDNGAAICAACAQFIVICRQIGLFQRALGVVDGSKFKGVNARDKNFTRGKVKKRLGRLRDAIAGYLASLDAADREENINRAASCERLRGKLALLQAQVHKLKAMETAVEAAPDHQVSLTDPDTHLMVTGDRLAGVVGYNVQTAVETEHHLIIAHEVTNQVGDRGQLPEMAAKARDALGFAEIDVIADKGYFRGPDLLACRDTSINALVPKADTSNARAAGCYGKEDFLYLQDQDAYRCPAGELLTRRFETVEGELAMSIYWTTTCPACPLKTQCTTGKERRVRRWEHEGVVEALSARMEAIGDAMAIRRETVEHPFATIKAWMGATHFLCKGLKAVRTEMSLHVLAYNFRRVLATLGVRGSVPPSPPEQTRLSPDSHRPRLNNDVSTQGAVIADKVADLDLQLYKQEQSVGVAAVGQGVCQQRGLG
jgi:transposase